MICYLDSCRDKVLKVCTPTKFQELTESQRTSMLIDAYRSGENPDAKSQLPAFVFMGIDPDMLEGKPGKRQKACLVPTGLVMLDFDHIEDPHQVYDTFLKSMPKLGLTLEHDLALAHITPSKKGLRLVVRIRKGKSVVEMQEAIGKLVGVECDKAVKDLSRLSFCPKAEDILYINKSLLFGEIQNDRNTEIQKERISELCKGASLRAADERDGSDDPRTALRLYGVNKKDSAFGTQSAGGDCDYNCLSKHSTDSTESQQTSDTQQATEQQDCPEGTTLLINPVQAQRSAGIEDSPTSDAARRDAALLVSGSKIQDSDAPSRFPVEYHGVPYKEIVEKWIELRGGKPEPGDRHATLVELAMDLRKICDNDKEWIASLMPDFDKGEQEKRDCIEWAVGRQHSKISGTLYDALAALGIARNTEGQQSCRNTEIQKYRNTEGSGAAGFKFQDSGFKFQDSGSSASADSSLFTLHSSLSEQSEDAMPPALPEELPSLVRLMTSKVLDHQKPAVASMMFPALATHVNNCLFKLRDNTDVELSLMCCLLAQQSVGKGCVKAPLRLIMNDIKVQDKVNRQRERQWQEEQKNKKANEKGKSRPDDIVIRILSSDTTPAAFLGRLMAAENGDGENQNLCTYSQVDEIEDLYRFCASGGRNMVQQMIKRTWDRDDIGAERWSANSANISTVLRWNWAASSTIEGGKKFFKSCLTDGTTSRVDFCTIIPPNRVIDFCYGDYDDEFEEALKPYIDNLKKFACAKTENGKVIPCSFPEIRALEGKMNTYINDTASTMPDNTWENYAWRAKVMAIKKLIVLYIANGCKWEDAFESFVWWSFNYGMWCKMNLFYDAAVEQFKDEQLRGNTGNKSPLKDMKRTFTLAEFAVKCQEMKCKTPPNTIIRKYKQRGIVVEKDNGYIINPEFCRKWNIGE